MCRGSLGKSARKGQRFFGDRARSFSEIRVTLLGQLTLRFEEIVLSESSVDPGSEGEDMAPRDIHRGRGALGSSGLLC